MTVLYAGGELESVTRSSTSVTSSTSTTYRNTSYTRVSILIPNVNSEEYIRTPPLATGVPLAWLHFECYSLSAPAATWVAAHPWVQFFKTGSLPVFRLQVTAHVVGTSNTIQAQYYNGSAWVDVGSTYSVGYGVLTRWDVKLSCGGSSESTAQLYKDGVLQATYSWTSAYTTDVINVQIGRPSYSQAIVTHLSQLLLATTDTTDMRVITVAPTGAGTYTAGAGSYTDINETDLSDVTGWRSDVADEKYSWIFADPPAGISIRAVVFSSRASRNATGPQALRHVVKNGASEAVTADLILAEALGTVQSVLELNPITGGTWGVTTDLNPMEFGIQSRT